MHHVFAWVIDVRVGWTPQAFGWTRTCTNMQNTCKSAGAGAGMKDSVACWYLRQALVIWSCTTTKSPPGTFWRTTTAGKSRSSTWRARWTPSCMSGILAWTTVLSGSRVIAPFWIRDVQIWWEAPGPPGNLVLCWVCSFGVCSGVWRGMDYSDPRQPLHQSCHDQFFFPLDMARNSWPQFAHPPFLQSHLPGFQSFGEWYPNSVDASAGSHKTMAKKKAVPIVLDSPVLS